MVLAVSFLTLVVSDQHRACITKQMLKAKRQQLQLVALK